MTKLGEALIEIIVTNVAATVQEILEMTGGGVDYSFECAGNVDVLREAFLCTHDVCKLLLIFLFIYVTSSRTKMITKRENWNFVVPIS